MSANPSNPPSRNASTEVKNCPICLRSLLEFEYGPEGILEKEAVITTPCGHDFGALCLYKWLYEHTSCPICRRQLSYAILFCRGGVTIPLRTRINRLVEYNIRTVTRPAMEAGYFYLRSKCYKLISNSKAWVYENEHMVRLLQRPDPNEVIQHTGLSRRAVPSTNLIDGTQWWDVNLRGYRDGFITVQDQIIALPVGFNAALLTIDGEFVCWGKR